jgi:predicted nucleic acid-binding protein
VYLIDSSALWRLQRDPDVRERWRAAVEAGEVRSCSPQRIEMCRSARDLAEFEQMTRDLALFYPDVAVPKGVWRWTDAAQHVLVRAGALRAFSLVDLLICGTAAHHGLAILHDDGDFETAARHLTDVRQRRIRRRPAGPPAAG